MASNVVSNEDMEKSDVDKGLDEEAVVQMLNKDAKRREVTTEIYDSLLDMLDLKVFQNFSSEINAQYGDYTEIIRSNRTLLQRKKFPIVVTGDTSAGKSSLINLLIAEDLLPFGVLKTSVTITNIYNSKEKKAIVTKENGEQIHIDNPTRKMLKEYIAGKKSEQNARKYKSVDIFMPVPLLKDHAFIVDTPGIEDFGKMPANLQDYLSEAVAFIYVINASNAGGVQQDRVGSIFKRQQELEEKGSLYQFDPNCTIFVLNKWDQVPDDEDEEVLQTITETLQKYWPTSRNTDIAEQMFRLSTIEAKSERKKMQKSERFQTLISGFERLIGGCLERRVERHINWLQMFLNRVLTIVIAKENASRNSREKNDLLKKEAEKRLELLKNHTEKMKSNMENLANEQCNTIAELLWKHLNMKDTINAICNWQENDFPMDKEFYSVEMKARRMISKRIDDQFFEMSRKLKINEKWASVFDKLKQECEVIHANFHEIDLIIQGNSPSLGDNVLPIRTTYMYSNLSKSVSSPNTDLLLWTSPLWVPPALLVLPFAILANYIKEKLDIRRYEKDKRLFMNTLAETMIKRYDKNAIYNGLCLTLHKQFMSNLNKICENIIPNKIKADQELLKNISKENRDSQTLIKEYTPIKVRCMEHIGNLLYVKMKYFPDKQIRILKEGGFIGRGSYAIVHQCYVDIGGCKLQCAVKRLSTALQHSDRYHQLSEAENMMKCQHKNIVRCLGIFISQTENKEYLEIFMDKCDCSLADVFLCYQHPTQMCQCNSHRRETCHRFEEKNRNCQDYNDSLVFFTRMLKDILDGLVYLHDEGFTHRDLKLSNMLIEGNTAKIADIGMLKPQQLVQGTIIGTLAFMAPEVLEGQIYDSSADIFSLAITMWEMWYGRSVVSSCEYRDLVISYNCVKENVIKGVRPNLETNWTPPDMIKKMIETCWEKEPNKRPTAKNLTTTLDEIVTKLNSN